MAVQKLAFVENCAVHQGERFAQLRRDRGLTQQDVSDAAGRSVQTLRGYEGRADYSTTPKTIVQLLGVLDRTAPLTADDIKVFSAAHGIDLAPLLPSHRRAEKLRSLVAEAGPAFNTPENRLLMSISSLAADERAVFEEVFDLIDAFGPEHSLRMIRAARTIATTAGVRAPASAPAQHTTHKPRLSVVSPPRLRDDGATEHEVIDYEVPTPTPAPAQPTAHTPAKHSRRKEA